MKTAIVTGASGNLGQAVVNKFLAEGFKVIGTVNHNEPAKVNLDNPNFEEVAVDLMDLISRRTEKGAPFHTDARLRPNGEKGLLVNTLEAYEEYYRRRAQLWEIQSLTRTRPVAGDMALGRRFQELTGRLTDFKSFSPAGAGVRRIKSPKRISESGIRFPVSPPYFTA